MRTTRRANREPEVDPFYDMLFNMLIAFVFCFIVALLAMNTRASKAGDVPAKAEVMITLSWPDNDPNDLDAWVQGPTGEVVWFRQRDAGLLHLDRDDRGLSNDTVVVDGRTIVNPVNQEVVTLRGIEPGEYVVNAHYYDGSRNQVLQPGEGGPVAATVSVMKVNPRAEVVFHATQTLAKPGTEVTFLRFTLQADGSIANINTVPKALVKRI
jgi:hypothetical protein